MSGVYFIGDLHLGHKNIMKFGQRSMFSNVDEHDVGIMERWNSVVRKQHDLVYVLGDVAMTVEALDLMRAFNGRKILIMGNHDTFDTQVYLKYFEKVCAFQKKYHGMVFTHIPIHPHEMRFGWKWNIHGHIHHLDKGIPDKRYINVNADWRNLTPVSLEELREEIRGLSRFDVPGTDTPLIDCGDGSIPPTINELAETCRELAEARKIERGDA